MNYQNESKELIEAFKDEVKKKLPIWLKTNESELRDFLEELEDHIWDKATELADGGKPSLMHVRESIIIMGSPKKIAKEFRTRGNPKFYVTEELWPAYYKSLIFAGVFVLFINMLTMGIDLAQSPVNIGARIGEAFEGTFAGFAYTFVGITLIFVSLSYHGYLPDDFRKIVAEQDKKKERTGEKKRKRIPKPKSVIPSSGSYLFEGIMGLVGGSVLILYPFLNIEFVAMYMSALPGWLDYVGAVMIASGVIRFSQALIGRHVRFQQLFLTLGIIPMCLNLALLWQLHLNDHIIKIGLMQATSANIPTIVYALVIVFTIFSVMGMLGEINKIVRLEMKGFEPKPSKFDELMNNNH